MFVVDDRLASSSFKILDWRLSEVRLKDNQYFPWLILVPRVSNSIAELFELEHYQQTMLMDEMTTLSRKMKDYFRADKMNVGMLGNIVSQLHIHVIVRFKDDLSWPHSLWQASVSEKPYDFADREKMIVQLRSALS